MSGSRVDWPRIFCDVDITGVDLLDLVGALTTLLLGVDDDFQSWLLNCECEALRGEQREVQ